MKIFITQQGKDIWFLNIFLMLINSEEEEWNKKKLELHRMFNNSGGKYIRKECENKIQNWRVIIFCACSQERTGAPLKYREIFLKSILVNALITLLFFIFSWKNIHTHTHEMCYTEVIKDSAFVFLSLSFSLSRQTNLFLLLHPLTIYLLLHEI